MKVWKSDQGYVNIWIMGEYPERLVNRCIENGVGLSNCSRSGGCIAADVSVRDFKRLRPLARGSGTSVRIAKKHGAPVIRRAAAGNSVFAVSLLICALAVFAASFRLWFIRIGTVSIPEEEIKAVLGGMGVRSGVLRRGLSTKLIADALEADTRIVSARVALKGVTLTVDIDETQAAVPEEKSSAPSEIIADKDCVISFIAVSWGHAAVKAGTAVRKGDLLITGDLSSEKEGYMVRADGMILGEVSYSASSSAERCVVKKARSGEKSPAVALTLFGREFMLRAPYEDYELEPAGSLLFNASPIPVGIRLFTCYEKRAMPFIDTDEGVCLRAKLKAQERLFGLLPREAGIIAVSSKCSINEDGSAYAVMTVTTVEKIGSRREY